jgi:hypothetical protein
MLFCDADTSLRATGHFSESYKELEDSLFGTCSLVLANWTLIFGLFNDVVSSSEHVVLLWLYSPCGSWLLFQFPNLYAVSRTNQSVARLLPTHRTTQTE